MKPVCADISENIQRYCETCFAKKSGKDFECDVQNLIKSTDEGKCHKVILHLPGKKDEIMCNCACSDEARIYSDYLSNAIWIGVKQALIKF